MYKLFGTAIAAVSFLYAGHSFASGLDSLAYVNQIDAFRSATMSMAEIAKPLMQVAESLPTVTSGRSNLSLIWQDGAFNTASIDQTGGRNVGLIRQIGYSNSAAIQQTGQGHQALIYQQGRNNVAIISQR